MTLNIVNLFAFVPLTLGCSASGNVADLSSSPAPSTLASSHSEEGPGPGALLTGSAGAAAVESYSRRRPSFCDERPLYRSASIEERQICEQFQDPPSPPPSHRQAAEWILRVASHIEWWSGLTTADRIGDLSEELLLLPVPSQGVTMTYAHSGRTIVCRKPDIAAELRRAEGFCHDWLLGAVSFLAQAMLHGTVYRIAFEENAGALILGAYPEGARMYFREESGRLMLVKLELLLGPIGGH